LGSSAAPAEQKFAVATIQASSNLPNTGAHDHFTTANTRTCFDSNFIAKSSQPIAITIRFGSLVLSGEEYNQGKFVHQHA
jgi:hypothetical protein